MLEEFRGPASIGAEEEAFFPINDTGVEVGDGHWWGANGCFAVNLGGVLGNDFRIGTTKPLAGYWESTITTDFGDSGFLQKG